MQARQDIENRFGAEALAVIGPRIGTPPIGGSATRPADQERSRGALVAAAIGEALGAPVEERTRRWIAENHGQVNGYLVSSPETGSDTLLTLITADAILANPVEHPARFASRLLSTDVVTSGSAVNHAKSELLAGRSWWQAGLPKSAGTAGAARCVSFGLLWAGDPQRAAYEAALSTAVTHGHPAGITAAAALAAAVALAATGDGPLDGAWIEAVTDIASQFEQGAVAGKSVVDRLRILPALLGQPPESVLEIVGTGAIAIEAVPAALWCAASSGDGVASVFEAVQAGGDTDTIAAMTGACVGARLGETIWSQPMAALKGLDEVRVVADRISGFATSTGESASATSDSPVSDKGSEGDRDKPVHVWFLIDRSGSMSGLVGDVVGGFNSFVDEQRNQVGECRLTAVQFDSDNPFEVMFDAVQIASVPALDPSNYMPRGMTPLFDSLGNLIKAADRNYATLSRTEDQIVVVFTDGMENASTEWTREALFNEINQRKADGWTFVFMGANQDSYATGGRLGFDPGSVQNFRSDSLGTRASWQSVGRAVRDYRGSDSYVRQLRRSDFFDGVKEAEEDLLNR